VARRYEGIVVKHELVTMPDPGFLATSAAQFVETHAASAIADHGRFTFAVSGGATPWAMFAELRGRDVDWASVEIFQVDERVAPHGDPDRNLTHLKRALGSVPASVQPMPVNDDDLDRAAAEYAGRIPEGFDLVHLGLGPDGHTASLVPGDPVLEVTDRLVALTLPYQGHVRMTMTYPALGRAEEILWLVSGEDKRDALGKLLAGDQSIPAGRVVARHSTIVADRNAV
jgi:6-phosphogluconolactonase